MVVGVAKPQLKGCDSEYCELQKDVEDEVKSQEAYSASGQDGHLAQSHVPRGGTGMS